MYCIKQVFNIFVYFMKKKIVDKALDYYKNTYTQ